jgi:hypothetical protein
VIDFVNYKLNRIGESKSVQRLTVLFEEVLCAVEDGVYDAEGRTRLLPSRSSMEQPEATAVALAASSVRRRYAMDSAFP